MHTRIAEVETEDGTTVLVLSASRSDKRPDFIYSPLHLPILPDTAGEEIVQ